MDYECFMTILGAIHRGSLGDVEFLVDDDPTVADAVGGGPLQGFTPLMMAAACNRREIVVFLLKSGAGVDREDCNGCTALFHACLHGHAPIVAPLLDAGADPTKLGILGFTPLTGGSFVADTPHAVRGGAHRCAVSTWQAAPPADSWSV
jgi:ankyrin repeat protein